MNKQILVWQIIVLLLGMSLVLTIREYLLDKNEIEAETARAQCIAEMVRVFPNEERFAVCSDIKTYKLKFNE
ncbi:MAG: hypothetical protein ABIG86_02940 [Patescibacteria group bacterium]